MTKVEKNKSQKKENSSGEFKIKKTKNMGIWVTENFHSDLEILQQAYPEYSINELLYFITGVQIEILKQSKKWEKVNELVNQINDSKKSFISDSKNNQKEEQ